MIETIGIKSITKKAERVQVYDIEVADVHHYLLKNGIASHNSIGAGPYAGNTVGGGTGSVYMSSIIVELSKAQDKDGDEVVGAWISAKSVKNRFARERQKVKMNIKFGTGLKRYSGLFEFLYDEEQKLTRKGNYYQNPWTNHSLLRKDFTDEIWEQILQAGAADFLRKRFAYQSGAEDLLDEDTETTDEAVLLEEGEE